MSTIFKKIIDKEIPADIIYEDEFILAFKDINPVAPIHILVIPKEEIATVNDIDNELLAGKLILAAKNIAKNLGIAQDGYRLIINCNKNGGQEVYHLHCHLIGGRKLDWPLG